MRQAAKLAFGYMVYYKKQSLSILLSIILSAALIAGISSLIYSGERSNLEKERQSSGDYHFTLEADVDLMMRVMGTKHTKDYSLEKVGVYDEKKSIEEPFIFSFVYGDETYRQMKNRKILEGHYPVKGNEIALDAYTMRNLNIPSEIGSIVPLSGNDYTLSGIISNEWISDTEEMVGFVAEETKGENDGQFLYLKFDEKKDLQKQSHAFLEEMKLSQEDLYRNSAIVGYLGYQIPSSFWAMAKDGIGTGEWNFTSLLLTLRYEFNLTVNGVIAILGLFSAFIVYSIYNITLSLRLSQYGILQTLGIGRGNIFKVVLWELWTLFLIGYPLGCMLGNTVAKIGYANLASVFSDIDAVSRHFYISITALGAGGIYLFLLLGLMGLLVVCRIEKETVIQMISKQKDIPKGKRKCYSKRYRDLTSVLINKFMFSRKGVFFGLILSLSLGGFIALNTGYVVDNTRANNELTLKADDGLGSDFQVYLESSAFTDMIPKEAVRGIEENRSAAAVHPVSYFLGEIAIPEDTLLWKEYFPEAANKKGLRQDARLMEYFNGICTKTDAGYGIKSNLYGYDDGMLREMNAYRLDGSIDGKTMREENTIILRTMRDGQNNYDGLDIKAGDQVMLKVPKKLDLPQNGVKFTGPQDWYEEKEFTVGAVVKRAMAQNRYFIGDAGLDIVMTNRQMEENFGIDGYNMISINKKAGVDAAAFADEISMKIQGIPRCIVKDYTAEIQRQEGYLREKMFFFYGIAAVIMAIGMFHIMNSLSHLVLSRRREFGILRAMGLSDAGLLRMMAREGLQYGICTCAVMLLLFSLSQRVLSYLLEHVYLYINEEVQGNPLLICGVMGIIIWISVTAVIVPARQVIKENLIAEIRE